MRPSISFVIDFLGHKQKQIYSFFAFHHPLFLMDGVGWCMVLMLMFTLRIVDVDVDVGVDTDNDVNIEVGVDVHVDVEFCAFLNSQPQFLFHFNQLQKLN